MKQLSEYKQTVFNTELLDAVRTHSIDRVELAIKKGADINVVDAIGSTALFQACLPIDLAMITVLLKYKANPNIQDKDGWTPLMAAALSSEDAVLLLLEGGANPLLVNRAGKTALQIVTELSNFKIKEILIKAEDEWHKKMINLKSQNTR